MAILHEYHRPASLDEALSLLSEPAVERVVLAGGTTLVGQLETRARRVDGVVDLADLDLHYLIPDQQQIRIGALVTLTDLSAHAETRELANGILVRAARGEGPVNLRNAATIGGIVASGAVDSELFAALLALQAVVEMAHPGGKHMVPLEELESIQGIISEVRIPRHQVGAGLARVARTAADRPIVAAVAVVAGQTERVALCGVAPRPVLAGSPLDPAGDAKGSRRYRLAMAQVLTPRALTEARGAAAGSASGSPHPEPSQ